MARRNKKNSAAPDPPDPIDDAIAAAIKITGRLPAKQHAYLRADADLQAHRRAATLHSTTAKRHLAAARTAASRLSTTRLLDGHPRLGAVLILAYTIKAELDAAQAAADLSFKAAQAAARAADLLADAPYDPILKRLAIDHPDYYDQIARDGRALARIAMSRAVEASRAVARDLSSIGGRIDAMLEVLTLGPGNAKKGRGRGKKRRRRRPHRK